MIQKIFSKPINTALLSFIITSFITHTVDFPKHVA